VDSFHWTRRPYKPANTSPPYAVAFAYRVFWSYSRVFGNYALICYSIDVFAVLRPMGADAGSKTNLFETTRRLSHALAIGIHLVVRELC
jgi:hypothetical protein